MNIEEIQEAVTELSPDDLARFRAWFQKYERNIQPGETIPAPPLTREQIHMLRGSLKGSGAMKSLMEERRKE
ncbi:MAG TPA: hypothetical protein VJ821_14570 [Anaerolineales bacterium]|nr:hypothetical protein [Anaerolineales bacterium]